MVDYKELNDRDAGDAGENPSNQSGDEARNLKRVPGEPACGDVEPACDGECRPDECVSCGGCGKPKGKAGSFWVIIALVIVLAAAFYIRFKFGSVG